MKSRFNILSIVGPTASGKTKLAVKLALRYNGEIISGDSRQVFRGMDIGTGKDLEEYVTPSGTVPYHLIDIADPREDYSLYRYISDFRRCFDEISWRGKLPVLCGGSGLYIEGALKGYELPDIPVDHATRSELEGKPKEELLSILQMESPETLSRTDISSTRRIIRGVEIARYLKQNALPSHTETPAEYRPFVIGISLPREEIIRRIDLRLEMRLQSGMINEAASLLEQGVPAEKMIKLGLEYRYCTMYLLSQISYENMIDKLRTEIHRFAKRQMTWFRGMERRGIPINWIEGDDFTKTCIIIDESLNI